MKHLKDFKWGVARQALTRTWSRYERYISDLVDREELKYVQVYVFQQESEARYAPAINGIPASRFSVKDKVCVRRGSPGLLGGIGRKPAEYRVRVSAPWEVVNEFESVQSAGARIRYRPSRNLGLA